LGVIVFLAAAIVYLPTLGNGFAFDDEIIVRDNPMIRSLANVPKIFSSGYGEETGLNFVLLYRPLVILSFASNYAAFGDSPFSFHLVNLLLHAANSLLLFLFLLALFSDLRISFIAGLLFALHPVASEAVCPVVGRCDTLATFFSLLFLLYYVRSWRRGTRRLDVLIASVLLFLALLSKEHAVVFVPLALICDILFREDFRTGERHLRRRFAAYGAFAGVVLIYILIRYAVIGAALIGGSIAALDNPLILLPQVERFFGAGKVFLLYLVRLVFPLRLSCDYSYNEIEFDRGVGAQGLAFMLVAFVIVLLLYWTYRKERRAFFGLLFFAVAFSIVSNFVFLIGTVMAERLLYVPLIGFAIFASCAIESVARLAKSESVRRAVLIIAVCVISVLLGVRTFLRTFDWRNTYTVFESAIKVSPGSARVQLCYGRELHLRGKYERAIDHFGRALSIVISPGQEYFSHLIVSMYFEMGNSYKRLNRLDEAIRCYHSALTEYFALIEAPGRALEADDYVKRLRLMGLRLEHILFNMGLANLQNGNLQEAEKAYLQAIQINDKFPEAYNDLAVVYGDMGRYDKAENITREGLKIAPDNALLHYTLGAILEITGRREEARPEFEETLRLNPDKVEAREGLKRLQGEKKE
jgi:hypothetical protein